jgi:hypothetical protein
VWLVYGATLVLLTAKYCTTCLQVAAHLEVKGVPPAQQDA